MFSFQDHKFSSTHLLNKFKRQLTRQLLQYCDAVRLCITGISTRPKMTKNKVFMRWLPKISKLLKSFCYWLAQFKELKTKSMNLSRNSISSNGSGKNLSANLSKIFQKDLISLNCLLMKPSLRSLLILRKISKKLNLRSLLEPCNLKPNLWLSDWSNTLNSGKMSMQKIYIKKQSLSFIDSQIISLNWLINFQKQLLRISIV